MDMDTTKVTNKTLQNPNYKGTPDLAVNNQDKIPQTQIKRP